MPDSMTTEIPTKTEEPDSLRLAIPDLVVDTDLIHKKHGLPGLALTEGTKIYVNTAKDRDEALIDANREVAEKCNDPGIQPALEIGAELTSNFNKIFRAQLENTAINPVPKSWAEYDPHESVQLKEKINELLTKYEKFLKENPSIESGLKFARDVLIIEKDPQKIYEAWSKYIALCIKANNEGEIILFIPFDSDYTKAQENIEKPPTICEASFSMVLPLSRDDRNKINMIREEGLRRLEKFGVVHQKNTQIDAIVGYYIMGAGANLISTPSGEALVTKTDEGHKHEIYVAVNNILKNEQYAKIAGSERFLDATLPLLILHELSHRLFPEGGLFGEIPADIPSSIAALDLADKFNLPPSEIVKAMLAEQVSEINENVANKNWYEGTRAELIKGDEFSNAYLLSGVLIVNALTESGLVKIESNNLEINSNEENIANFQKILTEKWNGLKNESVDGPNHSEIKKAVGNVETLKIVNFVRSKLEK